MVMETVETWWRWKSGSKEQNSSLITLLPLMLNPLDTAALKGGWLSLSASGVGIIGHSCIKESGFKLHASYESKLSKGHRTNG